MEDFGWLLDFSVQNSCSQRTSNNISRKRVLIQLEQLELLTLFYMMLPVVSRIK